MDEDEILIAPLLRKNRRLKEKLDAWLDLLDAAGLAAVCDFDGEEVTVNSRARDHLLQLKSKSSAVADVAEVLWEAEIELVLAEPGLCVWKPPSNDVRHIDLGALSKREREVARWLRHGKSAADIGKRLGISPRTVEKHTQSIFNKCGVHSDIEFIRSIPHGEV